MKIVQFKDGTFGVRRWSWSKFGWVFLDLRNPSVCRSLSSKYIRDCHGELDEVMDIYIRYSDKGTVFKSKECPLEVKR